MANIFGIVVVEPGRDEPLAAGYVRVRAHVRHDFASDDRLQVSAAINASLTPPVDGWAGCAGAGGGDFAGSLATPGAEGAYRVHARVLNPDTGTHLHAPPVRVTVAAGPSKRG